MPHPWDRRRRLILLAGIVLLALAFRLWGLTWGLHDATIERRPHPDEWVVYWLSRWFDRSHSLNPCPSPATRCFFDWGSVYIYLAYGLHVVVNPLLALLPAHAFGPRADPGFVDSVLVGRIASAIMSTAAVVAVYKTAQVAFVGESGLVAALVVATSALPIQLAHFATPDSTVMFLVAATLLLLVLAVCRDRPLFLVAAGATAGLALGAEYHMLLLLVPLVVAWFLVRCSESSHLVLALLAMAGAFLVANPYTVLDLPAFLSAMHHTLLIRTVDSGAQYQGRFNAYAPDWLFVVRYPLGYGVGALFTVWLVAGVIWAGLRHRPVHLLLLSWILPYGIVESLSAAKFMRYGEPLLPALAVLAGGFAWEMLTHSRGRVRLLASLSALAALLYSSMYDSAYAALFSRPEARYVASQWVQTNVAPHALLAFEQLPNGLINLPYFTAGLGYRPCFTEFRTGLSNASAHYVLTDGYAKEEHPRIPATQVARFQAMLANRKQFRIAKQVFYEPSFLGIEFPIDGSPHDWRYVDRDITVYERVATNASGSDQCYATVAQAVAALYPKHKHPPA